MSDKISWSWPWASAAKLLLPVVAFVLFTNRGLISTVDSLPLVGLDIGLVTLLWWSELVAPADSVAVADALTTPAPPLTIAPVTFLLLNNGWNPDGALF